MKKVGTLALIIFTIGFVYLMLLVFQPTINSMAETANSSVNATTYPETQAVIQGFPFWIWLVPASVGMVAVVVTLSEK